MNNNYYEIGTVGTTPIYEPVRAKRRALGKLYTESELQKAVKEEREECAVACEKMINSLEYGQGRFAISYCAKAIRERGEE